MRAGRYFFASNVSLQLLLQSDFGVLAVQYVALS